MESMEDTEEQESLARRSSGRRRKSPHRFVAEAATNRVGGDFVQPKKRERPQPPPLEELNVSPESLLNRRVAVCHKRGKVEQWFEGTITEHHPEAALPFVVLFEDGDCYSGSFGTHVLRTKGKDHLYKFLDGDTERARLTQGATEHSSPPAEPVAARPLLASREGPSSAAAAAQPLSAQDAGMQSDSVPGPVPRSSSGAGELSTAAIAGKDHLQTAMPASGPVAETQTAPPAMLPSNAGHVWGNVLKTCLVQPNQASVPGVAPAGVSQANAASREPTLLATVPGTDREVKPLPANSSHPADTEVAAQRLLAPQGAPSSAPAAAEPPSVQDAGMQPDSAPASVPRNDFGAGVAPAAVSQPGAASREPTLPAAVPGTDEDVKPVTQVKAEQVKAELPVNSASMRGKLEPEVTAGAGERQGSGQDGTQPASIPADAVQPATAASLQQPALQAPKSSSEAAPREPAARAAAGDALVTARSTAKAEGRVKRALDVNAAPPRARQAAEQQHPGPSQRAAGPEAPAASETGRARESALGNDLKASAAGASSMKSACGPKLEESSRPSNVTAPVFTEVSIPGLSDPVQPGTAAAKQATASKQLRSASAASAGKLQAAGESAEASSPAGTAVEATAPAVCENLSALPNIAQAAEPASQALPAFGVAAPGGLAAAGASEPMKSKIHSRETFVAASPSRAMAAAEMQSAEQAVASALAKADGIPMTEATVPASAAAVAKSDPESQPVKASPPPASTPAAVATSGQKLNRSPKPGTKVASAQQEGNRLSGTQQKRRSPSDPSAAREKRQKVEPTPSSQEADGSPKSGGKVSSAQQEGNRLSGAQQKGRSPSDPAATAREKRQNVERTVTANAVSVSERREGQEPGVQPSSGLAGSAVDLAVRGAAIKAEPATSNAAAPPSAKRQKLNLASLLAGKVADGSPAALRDPRALLQPGGAGKASRVTSLAAPLSFSALPASELPAAAKSESPDGSDDESEAGSAGPSDEQVEAEVICQRMDAHLAGLTRARDSIGRATSTALAAAAVNAAPRVIRQIADAMEKVATPAKRVDMLYLIDSILQGSQREGRPGCGPGSMAAKAFPKVIAAGLTRLIAAVMVSQEGVEKASKVLSIWQSRKLIQESLLAIQIAKLEAAKAALKDQAPPPQLQPAGHSSVTAKGRKTGGASQPGKGKTVQIAAGTGTASAVLEDEYGTHLQPGSADDVLQLRRRDDSSDSESDDEPDEHERQLRLQTAQQESQKAATASRSSRQGGPFYSHAPWASGTDPETWTAEQAARGAVPWGAGTEPAARSKSGGYQGPSGFSPSNFSPSGALNIQLRRGGPPPRALNPLQAMNYPPPDRLPGRAPGVSTGYRAPAVSAFAGSSYMDDDRLDMAGAGDRTFEDLPPLPADDWDAGPPPLPEEAPPPLPGEEPPPLPAEPPPPLQERGPVYSSGEQQMDWEAIPNSFPGQLLMPPGSLQPPPHVGSYPPHPQLLHPRVPFGRSFGQ